MQKNWEVSGKVWVDWIVDLFLDFGKWLWRRSDFSDIDSLSGVSRFSFEIAEKIGKILVIVDIGLAEVAAMAFK